LRTDRPHTAGLLQTPFRRRSVDVPFLGMDLRDYLIRTSIVQTEYGRSATVEEDATVRHAIGVMRKRKVGCQLATRGGILCGILTERDLIRKVFGPGRSLDVPVHEVMTRKPVVAGPNEPLYSVLSRMYCGGFRHVPVVGEVGEALGTVSLPRVAGLIADSFVGKFVSKPLPPYERGVLEFADGSYDNREEAETRESRAPELVPRSVDAPEDRPTEGLGSEPLSALRLKPAVFVARDASVAHAVDTMNRLDIGCVLVGSDEDLAGIFSERDLLFGIGETYEGVKQRSVEEFMTTEPEMLDADTLLLHVLGRMAAGGFRHVSVTREKRVVGVVSLRDLLGLVNKWYPDLVG
jgi:CBS domain-containing protein